MKTFLTLLAAVTSLSAYTLVGVHANCAVCPTYLGSVKLDNQCDENGTTTCTYKENGFDLHCYYSDKGSLTGDSIVWCPQKAGTGHVCVKCQK